ncbi:hypothetical protein F2P81_021353 [Scophthalmus maximus]|uniref:Uncharacterized protein n=1 Tax=Scophthalmus maximus TaxID=52904 RepID=A0A6A4RV53_SCOMX|nr:hypothetical protein F2P81_021353 [Scophthalmus maximus]
MLARRLTSQHGSCRSGGSADSARQVKVGDDVDEIKKEELVRRATRRFKSVLFLLDPSVASRGGNRRGLRASPAGRRQSRGQPIPADQPSHARNAIGVQLVANERIRRLTMGYVGSSRVLPSPTM